MPYPVTISSTPKSRRMDSQIQTGAGADPHKIAVSEEVSKSSRRGCSEIATAMVGTHKMSLARCRATPRR